MITKLNTKSSRVKGLSFHNKRPWILCSLHDGIIQLWDYRVGTLIHEFEEHDGPVRGIDFHRSQPLFCSGGDDYKVKVWNHKLRRCLFTLLGHLDYIRTVKFHHEYPWILSASDDQTLRIWNWQSRSSIAVMTGHNHYIMSGCFHPKEDMVVSASLDHTIRVWDISGLRKKNVRGSPFEGNQAMGRAPMGGQMNSDLFGGADVIVKFVLEGHERGVNWATFHHSLPLIVSGADDRQVKLWRMSDNKAWEVDTLRGHTNNVWCALFHPKAELLISNSEDRSIRVWDIPRRQCIQTFKRDQDKFWMLAAHPEQNYLAAGHDSGMIVFKLERERPAYDIHGNTTELYYINDRFLRRYNYASGDGSLQVPLRRGNNSGPSAGVGSAAHSLIHNIFSPKEIYILVLSNTDGGIYELITLHESHSNMSAADVSDPKRGQARSAVFISKNKFAALDRSRQISIRNIRNEVSKRFAAPSPTADGLFPTRVVGRILIRSEDRVTLFDVESHRVLGEAIIPVMRFAVWSVDGNYVALVNRHTVMLCDKNLNLLCVVSEQSRIKSGSWGADGIFLYSTSSHIKYCIENGESSVVRSIDQPVYLTRVAQDQVFCIDRDSKVRNLRVDLSECIFKVALLRNKYNQVFSMIRSSSLCGHSIISYLQERGFPEIALHFVEDERTRFRLALECANLEIAQQAAIELDDPEVWNALAVEGLRQGNHKVVEMAYQLTQNFEKLSFLYLVTGHRTNLLKMLKIAEVRQDTVSRFHNALYAGNVEDRVTVLEEVGHFPLAYVTAEVHGLKDDAERIQKKLEELNMEIPSIDERKTQLLIPPNPITKFTEERWPLSEVPKSSISDLLGQTLLAEGQDSHTLAQANDVIALNGEEEGSLSFGDNTDEDKDSSFDAMQDGNWGGDGGDLDLDFEDDVTATSAQASTPAITAVDNNDLDNGSLFVPPKHGINPAHLWIRNSSLAADHVAAGSFETAMKLMNRQIGVINFTPLRESMLNIFFGARGVLNSFPGSTSSPLLIKRNQDTENGETTLPRIAIRLSSLLDQLKVAHKFFLAGKFKDALDEFRSILVSIPLLVVQRTELARVKSLVRECLNYVLGLLIELTRRSTESEVRQAELAAYFTCCELQPVHMLLVLNLAMIRAFKIKNFITSAGFARRLLAMKEISSPSQASLKTKAMKVLRKSEENARNEQKLNYPENENFDICCATFSPILAGESTVKCPFCGALAKSSAANTLCPICTLSPLGMETIGLVCSMDN